MGEKQIFKDIFITVALVIQKDNLNLESYIEKISKVLSHNFEYFEILIVDNTPSKTASKSEERVQSSLSNIRWLTLSRPYPIEIAYTAILENSLGDYVAIIDFLSFSPKVVMPAIKKILKGYEVVMVVRKRRDNGRSIVTKIWLEFMDSIFKRVLNTDFRPEKYFTGILSRAAVNSIIKIRNKRRFLRYADSFVGLKMARMHYRTKISSGKNPSFLDNFLVGIDILISNSKFPLRAATFLGVVASFLSFSFLVYVFIITLVKERIVEGWITTSIVTGSLFLILFLILTVLSEYVGRILTEFKDEPLYFISKETMSASRTEKRKKKKINVVK